MNELLKQQLYQSLATEVADISPVASAALEVDEETVEEAPLEAESSTAEAIDANEETQEVEETTEQVEKVTDITDTLDDLEVAMEGYGNGGKTLSVLESAALKLTISQVVRPFVKDTGNLIPATETFADDLEGNTTLAVEGLKETAKEFGGAALGSLKNLVVRVGKSIHAFVSRIASLTQRTDRLIVEAKGVTNTPNGNVKVNGKNLSLNGKVDAGSIRKGLDDLKGIIISFNEINTCDAAVDAIEKINEGTDKISITKYLGELNKYMEVSFTKIFNGAKSSDGNLVANQILGDFTPMLIRSGSENYISYDQLVRDEDKVSSATEAPALSSKEVLALAGTTKVLLEALKGIKNQSKQQEAAANRLFSVNIQSSKRTNSADENLKEMGLSRNEIFKQMIKIMNAEMYFFVQLASSAFDGVVSALEYGERSLKTAA